MTVPEFFTWMDAGEKLKLGEPLTSEDEQLIARHGNPLKEDAPEAEDDSYDWFDGPILNPTHVHRY